MANVTTPVGNVNSNVATTNTTGTKRTYSQLVSVDVYAADNGLYNQLLDASIQNTDKTAQITTTDINQAVV